MMGHPEVHETPPSHQEFYPLTTSCSEVLLLELVRSATTILTASIHSTIESHHHSIDAADLFLTRLFNKGLGILKEGGDVPTPNPTQHHGRTEE